MANGIREEALRVGRTEIRGEWLADFLRTILLNFHLRWGQRYRHTTVGLISVHLRPTFAGASDLPRDHLDAVHTTGER